MPTYVYRNLITNQTFEVKQSMKDEALTLHPETGEPVKRLVSAPAIAFKGSGFYANDSRSSGKTSTQSSAPDSGKAESSTAEGSKSADSASSSDSAAASSPKTEAPKAADKSSAASSAKSAAAPSSSSGGSGQ
ncbi:FmdB family transcriptional regulator [Deinococcus psychrotolerans]|uniref:FmdB family transcriptional regulator n=1 Tax=Deinococcus psychrotolerans TaxID=2489213 RepID=A0A3G8YDX8_9DEIO|nr:FmdB family transcriptional regulator [Deinococcus psychrotolerans]